MKDVLNRYEQPKEINSETPEVPIKEPPLGRSKLPDFAKELSQFRFGSSEVERLLCGEESVNALEALQKRAANCWNSSFSSLADISAPVQTQRQIRVCIATEEIVGPVRNGGIGTTYAYLSLMLGEMGIETTILYLRGQEVENGTIDQWVEHYAERGVKFVPVPNYAAVDRLHTGADRWLRAPYNMMRYLLEHPADVVHVSEWRGSAYLSLVAKQQGLAFSGTLFIVKTSSPWLWNRLYGSQTIDRVEDLTKIYAERKSVELADMVIGGSAHLLRWMSSQGYNLPPFRTFVQPNVVFFDHLKAIVAKRSNEPGSRVAITELVFFGRLEARKGIFIFCEAIKRLLNYGIDLPPRISFMGKPGARLTARPEQDIFEYIRTATEDWPCEVQIHTEFQQIDALEYLLGGERMAVMPSVIENSSLAVYEAIMCGIPFVASSSGGTSELVAQEDHEHVLCDAHPIPLANMIERSLRIGGYVARPGFDNDQNLAQWRDFHTALGRGLLDQMLASTSRPRESVEAPEITVCIYHTKNEDALRRTLDTLALQVHAPHRVLISLDCPADAAASARKIAEGYALNIECLDSFNYDAGLSFNVMARSVPSGYLLFLWSGSQLRAEALQALQRTAVASGTDVLNFFHRVVNGDNNSTDVGYLNASVLGSVSEAFFRSDLSPMPVMMTVNAFSTMGGFSTDYRVLGCEQEFVARCQVHGLACTTALMEMGSVEAWEPGWITARCYDEAVSHFRAIRPQIAAAPLALREMMLLSKGLHARTGNKKFSPRNAAPPVPVAKKKTTNAFNQLFALLDATETRPKTTSELGPSAAQSQPNPPPPAGNENEHVTGWANSALEQTGRRRETQHVRALRAQLHRLSDSSNFTGRLLGIHNMNFFGWVCDENQLDKPVAIECFRDGRKIAEVDADVDLDSAIPLPMDLRRHSFRLSVPKPFGRGRFGIPFDITLKVKGSAVTVAETRVGFNSLKAAGLDGHCEVVRPGVLNGWAWQIDEPDCNIEVAVFVDGHFLTRVPCIRERDDLKAAGVGYGNYGFEVTIPKALRDGARRIVNVVAADFGIQLKSGRLELLGNSLKVIQRKTWT